MIQALQYKIELCSLGDQLPAALFSRGQKKQQHVLQLCFIVGASSQYSIYTYSSTHTFCATYTTQGHREPVASGAQDWTGYHPTAGHSHEHTHTYFLTTVYLEMPIILHHVFGRGRKLEYLEPGHPTLSAKGQCGCGFTFQPSRSHI